VRGDERKGLVCGKSKEGVQVVGGSVDGGGVAREKGERVEGVNGMEGG
jgi:hypothetical protein